METTKTYSGSLVTVSFMLQDVTQGTAIGGDAISVDHPNESWAIEYGLDKSAVVNENPAGDYTEVVLTLSQTSSVNAVLQAIWNTARLAGVPAQGPLSVKDDGGTYKLLAADAIMAKPAPFKAGASAQNREWKFLLPHGVETGGGN
jgi:hypothetical protein